MKIRDFLKDFYGSNEVAIYDTCDYITHECRNFEQAILNYGHYTVKRWTIENGVINIHIYSLKNQETRTFLYEPYGDSGDELLLYFHKKPTSAGNFDDTWDMTGVSVPTKECPEWSFWRNIQNVECGNDCIPHDLNKKEILEIKNYIRKHKELVPNMYEEDID